MNSSRTGGVCGSSSACKVDGPKITIFLYISKKFLKKKESSILN